MLRYLYSSLYHKANLLVLILKQCFSDSLFYHLDLFQFLEATEGSLGKMCISLKYVSVKELNGAVKLLFLCSNYPHTSSRAGIC